MSPLSSAYRTVPPPRNKVSAVKFPAAPTGLMFHPLTRYAPDKAGDTVRRLDALYQPNGKPSTQLTDQQSRMLFTHILLLFAYIFQWIKWHTSQCFRDELLSRFLCPLSFPVEPFYFSSEETIYYVANMDLLRPGPPSLASESTWELKLFNS